jgi:hypothetical protein
MYSEYIHFYTLILQSLQTIVYTKITHNCIYTHFYILRLHTILYTRIINKFIHRFQKKCIHRFQTILYTGLQTFLYTQITNILIHSDNTHFYILRLHTFLYTHLLKLHT